jgi:hypothetical protein
MMLPMRSVLHVNLETVHSGLVCCMFVILFSCIFYQFFPLVEVISLFLQGFCRKNQNTSS